MPTTWKKLADFGKLQKKSKIIVVTLQEAVNEKGTNRYISFHEHFVGEKGELIPRSVKKEKEKQDGKFEERIISFTLPFSPETAKSLKNISNAISDYINDTPTPVDLDEEDPF